MNGISRLCSRCGDVGKDGSHGCSKAQAMHMYNHSLPMHTSHSIHLSRIISATKSPLSLLPPVERFDACTGSARRFSLRVDGAGAASASRTASRILSAAIFLPSRKTVMASWMAGPARPSCRMI